MCSSDTEPCGPLWLERPGHTKELALRERVLSLVCGKLDEVLPEKQEGVHGTCDVRRVCCRSFRGFKMGT